MTPRAGARVVRDGTDATLFVAGGILGVALEAMDLLAAGSAVAVTIPTPDSGPPMEKDDELAR